MNTSSKARTAVMVAALAGAALSGLAATGDAALADRQCPPWELTCGPGGFPMPADDGVPGDNAPIGGIPAPAVVPNVDGSLSPPGMPGDV